MQLCHIHLSGSLKHPYLGKSVSLMCQSQIEFNDFYRENRVTLVLQELSKENCVPLAAVVMYSF